MDVQDLSLLLVEPSQVQGRIISAQLENLGIAQIAKVKSSTEALESLSAATPDVVLSAMHLSDTTGADMLAALRASSAHRDLPFILISSERGSKYLEVVKQSGVTAMIDKPCKEADLHLALQRTVELIEPQTSEVSLEALSHMRVLVVDDSRAARRCIVRVLHNLGLRHFSEAEDGMEAAGMLERSTFDLVVTDYNMPRLDGHGLLRYIRNESSHPRIPVLMVTSESDESRLSAVSQLGVSALCDKPFEPNVVRRLIAGLVTSERSRD